MQYKLEHYYRTLSSVVLQRTSIKRIFFIVTGSFFIVGSCTALYATKFANKTINDPSITKSTTLLAEKIIADEKTQEATNTLFKNAFIALLNDKEINEEFDKWYMNKLDTKVLQKKTRTTFYKTIFWS